MADLPALSARRAALSAVTRRPRTEIAAPDPGEAVAMRMLETMQEQVNRDHIVSSVTTGIRRALAEAAPYAGGAGMVDVDLAMEATSAAGTRTSARLRVTIQR